MHAPPRLRRLRRLCTLIFHGALNRYGKQVWLIAWRSWQAVARNRAAIIGKIVPSLFFACVLGAIYSNVGRDQKSIQDKIGALFFFTINQVHWV